MILYFKRLPPQPGPPGDDYHGQVPARALQMEPEAAAAFLQAQADLGANLVCTDIYRSPEAILRAKQAKPSITQAAGWSAHGYGLAIDLDLDQTLKRLSMSYLQLTAALAQQGFFCHRRDGASQGSESWHFNYLGKNASAYLALASPDDHRSWAAPVEARIQDMFGTWLKTTPDQLDGQLTSMGYDLGLGRTECVRRFQFNWLLKVDGVAGPVTQRTLAFASATISYV